MKVITRKEFAVYRDDFTAFDCDGNGALDQDEIMALMERQCGHKLSEAEARQAKSFLRTVDLNRDGRVSLHEYLCFVHDTREYHIEPHHSYHGLNLEAIRSLAEEGHVPDAQLEMAHACHTGFHSDIPKDENKAQEWLRKAAEQGLPQAQWELGQCLLLGRGCEKDATAAEEWKKKAAEQGFSKSDDDDGFKPATYEIWQKVLGKVWMSKDGKRSYSTVELHENGDYTLEVTVHPKHKLATTKTLKGHWNLIDDPAKFSICGDLFVNGVYASEIVMEEGESMLALGPTCNANKFNSSGYWKGKPTILWTKEAFVSDHEARV